MLLIGSLHEHLVITCPGRKTGLLQIPTVPFTFLLNRCSYFGVKTKIVKARLSRISFDELSGLNHACCGFAITSKQESKRSFPI